MSRYSTDPGNVALGGPDWRLLARTAWSYFTDDKLSQAESTALIASMLDDVFQAGAKRGHPTPEEDWGADGKFNLAEEVEDAMEVLKSTTFTEKAKLDYLAVTFSNAYDAGRKRGAK